jgi:hypothetical protein
MKKVVVLPLFIFSLSVLRAQSKRQEIDSLQTVLETVSIEERLENLLHSKKAHLLNTTTAVW